jgi:hypothetical protein
MKRKPSREYARVTWTGGDHPPLVHIQTSSEFRAVRSHYFREYVRECGGLDLWQCAGTSPLERARILWNRATLDAWRTATSYIQG